MVCRPASAGVRSSGRELWVAHGGPGTGRDECGDAQGTGQGLRAGLRAPFIVRARGIRQTPYDPTKEDEIAVLACDSRGAKVQYDFVTRASGKSAGGRPFAEICGPAPDLNGSAALVRKPMSCRLRTIEVCSPQSGSKKIELEEANPRPDRHGAPLLRAPPPEVVGRQQPICSLCHGPGPYRQCSRCSRRVCYDCWWLGLCDECWNQPLPEPGDLGGALKGFRVEPDDVLIEVRCVDTAMGRLADGGAEGQLERERA